MDVRDWQFLDKQLEQFSKIKGELSGSGFAGQIAYTAFFWTLIQYHQSDNPADFARGAMSLPDHLLPAQRALVETICADLDAWLQDQDPAVHPHYDDLRAVLAVGLQASTSPILNPRGFQR